MSDVLMAYLCICGYHHVDWLFWQPNQDYWDISFEESRN